MDLYALLSVERTASLSDIKRAYYKLALEYHPDRNAAPEAKQKFQEVALAYEVLSDQNRRHLYDTTGMIESNGVEMGWKEFMEAAFPKISLNILDEFKEKYVGSAEEYEDILAAYCASEGSLKDVLNSVFWADSEQADRYYAIISRAISRKIVPKFKKFKPMNTQQLEKKRKKEEKEADEAAQLLEELAKKDDRVRNLENCILSRQKTNMDDIVSRLEAKYGGKKKKQRS